jgi:hypothetical protein
MGWLYGHSGNFDDVYPFTTPHIFPSDSAPFWTSKQYCVYSRNPESMSKREAFCFSNSGQIAMVFFENKKI